MAFCIVFYNTANVRNLYLTVNRYQVDTLWFLLCDCGNRIILKEGRRDFAIVTRKKCDNWWKTQEIQTLRKARNSVLYFRQPGLMKEDSIRIFCATRLRRTWFRAFFPEFFQDRRLRLWAIFGTLNGGQLTLSTQLIIQDYLIESLIQIVFSNEERKKTRPRMEVIAKTSASSQKISFQNTIFQLHFRMMIM